jgi:prephenate dehydrogenase
MVLSIKMEIKHAFRERSQRMKLDLVGCHPEVGLVIKTAIFAKLHASSDTSVLVRLHNWDY